MFTKFEGFITFLFDFVFYMVLATACFLLHMPWAISLGLGCCAGVFTHNLRRSIEETRKADKGDLYWLGQSRKEKRRG